MSAEWEIIQMRNLPIVKDREVILMCNSLMSAEWEIMQMVNSPISTGKEIIQMGNSPISGGCGII